MKRMFSVTVYMGLSARESYIKYSKKKIENFTDIKYLPWIAPLEALNACSAGF
jgi:hypothetical protein